MITLERISDLRAQIQAWRRAGERVALVPTMGNLHAGHVRLCTEARNHGQRVVTTIFVNPMQFGAGEDFDSYPRTLEADSAKLVEAGVDLLFAPSVAEVYPRGDAESTAVTVPGISEILCGASRPGHFRGVATVVCKLFNLVQPDVSLFGNKDFQQVAVIRQMVRDLDIPVEIVGIDTVREADGLAMSSRNGYLSSDERALAPEIYRTLTATAAELCSGNRDFAQLEAEGANHLNQAGFRTDYFVVRRAEDLSTPTPDDQSLVVLVAAVLGRARLIDNLVVAL